MKKVAFMRLYFAPQNIIFLQHADFNTRGAYINSQMMHKNPE
jgi:hypothetical protein